MPETTTAARPSHTRHVVLALIVAAYMITYMDRVNIASAVPVIQKDMGFSMITIGWIFASFRWGYAFFKFPADGWATVSAADAPSHWWSCGGQFLRRSRHSPGTQPPWECSGFSSGWARLGLSPSPPDRFRGGCCPQTRGFAQGVTHAASRLGAALTPALVVMMMIRFGWRMPFFVFGLIGLGWAALWYWYYRDTPVATLPHQRGGTPAH